MSKRAELTLNDLADYLSAEVPEIGTPERLEKFTQGQSNPTYRLSTSRGDFVLRAKPPGTLLKSAHMVEREFRVMQALKASDVPVPDMIHLAGDETSPIGRAFFVMEHLEGRVFFDPALPDQTQAARAAIYDAMNDVMARLHSVDLEAVGLSDYGKPGNYFARQIQRWSAQYLASRTSPNADMDFIAAWLTERIPADDGQVALVHGDFRLDNLMIAPERAEVIGVLDWELSTLGHPLADLAYQAMQWRLPHKGAMRGLGGLDRAALGLPSEAETVARYAERRAIAPPENWHVLLVFCFFRLAAILQGVVRRAADGNASNPQTARTYAEAIPILAGMAREITNETT